MELTEKTRNWIILSATLLLIVLWSYTAVSKLVEMDKFYRALLKQPLIHPYAMQLKYLVPLSELLIVCLLIPPRTRQTGLLLSAVWMFVFSIYVGLALFGVYENKPCACGGVLSSLGWKNHFYFNLFFLLTSISGYVLEKNVQVEQSHDTTKIPGDPPRKPD